MHFGAFRQRISVRGRATHHAGHKKRLLQYRTSQSVRGTKQINLCANGGPPEAQGKKSL